MSEGGDQEDKTEEPSHKKLHEAREKGQVAQSREVNTWVILFTATLLLGIIGPSLGRNLSDFITQFISRPESFAMDAQSVADLMGETFWNTMKVLLIPLAALFAAAFMSPLVQVGPLYSTESLIPKLEKIDPLKGAKRVFGSRAWIEFAKALLKMILVGALTVHVLMPIFSESPGMVGLTIGAMMDDVLEVTNQLLVATLSILFVFAAFDYGIQRFQLNNQLRMSKQELRDEYKQTEGDPYIKARLRELRIQRARRRMMASVPTADVIITNPTHYAIAMEYKQDKNQAPVVVAKGQDAIALKIREVAKEHNVPIVENPPLARAMYAGVEIDEEIPEEYYKAVAEIISYVFSLKKR